VTSDRAARVWAWIAAAPAGDAPASAAAPVSIAALCRAAVRRLGVDGASMTVMSGPAALEPLFASDGVSAGLEELQLSTGEGPCADDFRFGSPMLIPDLAAVTARWPVFVTTAVAAGAGAIFAFPLQAGAIRVGVLSLYRAKPGPLSPEELANGLVFADIALEMLLDSSAGIIASGGYQPLGGLAGGRAQIHQATGMISVQLGVSLAEALVRLRARAFADSAAVSDVAGEVVHRRLRFVPDPPAQIFP
jgi:hypothetical protein